MFIASPSITVHLGWMSRCFRDLFRPFTCLVSQIVVHRLQRQFQLRRQVLGLLSPLDCPHVSRPGWEFSPLHGAPALLLNRSHMYKDRVRICYCYDWRHPKQHPKIAPTTHFQGHPGDGGSGEKGHAAFGLLHPPGETKAQIRKISCPPSLLVTEPSNSPSPVP